MHPVYFTRDLKRLVSVGLTSFLALLLIQNLAQAADATSESPCAILEGQACEPRASEMKSLLQTSLRATCEAHRKAHQCAKIEGASSREDKTKFLSCENPQHLCEFGGSSGGTLIFSCGTGAASVVVDAAEAALAWFLPSTYTDLAQTLTEIPSVISRCVSNQEGKIAALGPFREGLSDENMRKMDCVEIQRFVEAKLNVIRQGIERRRQGEMARRGIENLDPFSMQLSKVEVTALNYDLQKSRTAAPNKLFYAIGSSTGSL